MESNHWKNTKNKLQYIKKPLKIIINSIGYINKLIKFIRKLDDYDVIIIGYPAYLDFLIVRIFGYKYLNKVIIDFFLSSYDTVILDRKIIQRTTLRAKLLFMTDKWLLKKGNKVMVDTNVNIDRYRSIFDLEKKNIYRVFVGSYFLLNPLKKEINKKTNNNKMNVGWVGSIIPLHGIEKILAVASLLREKDFIFHIIGDDPDNEWAERNSPKHHNQYINFYGRLNYHDSMEILSECDICLGIFGDSDKAKSVIPFKIFDYMALRKVIVTQNSRAIQELGVLSGLFMVDNTVNALVNQLMWIKKNIKNIQIKYPDIRQLMENDLRKFGILNNEKH
ncbi:hypothetical protein FMIA91_10000 [Fidelibacter multiformis]